jgi:hypothetical protein
MKNRRRKKLPLWQWPPFIVVTAFAVAILMVFLSRLGIPGMTVVASILAVLAAIAVVLWLVWDARRRRSARNLPGTITTLDGITRVRLEPEVFVFLDETSRRQASIDVAVSGAPQPFEALLCPGATRFLGREFRTEVYLIAGGTPHKAGFLPRGRDALMADGLAELAARGMYVSVTASVLGAGKAPDPARPYALLPRPFTVSVGVGDLAGILAEENPVA